MTKLMKKCYRRSNIEIHHVIEKRFRPIFRISPDYWPAVAMSKPVHRTITNCFRKAHGYNYKNSSKHYDLSKIKMRNIVKAVYRDMSILRTVALKQIDNYYVKSSENPLYNEKKGRR